MEEFSLKKYRDLRFMNLDPKRCLLISCDSAGAIGSKEDDLVKVSNYVLGRITSRVALLEILSLGGFPICVVGTLSVEPYPFAEEINEGIGDELISLGLDPKKILTGSTEKNFPTLQSAMGITAIGMGNLEEFKMGLVKEGDGVLLLGLPKVGQEVSFEDRELIDCQDVLFWREFKEVREIVPVGSRGIKGEMSDLEKYYNLRMFWSDSLPFDLDINKSAGPATSLLVVGNFEFLQNMASKTKKPAIMLGYLGNRCSLNKN